MLVVVTDAVNEAAVLETLSSLQRVLTSLAKQFY